MSRVFIFLLFLFLLVPFVHGNDRTKVLLSEMLPLFTDADPEAELRLEHYIARAIDELEETTALFATLRIYEQFFVAHPEIYAQASVKILEIAYPRWKKKLAYTEDDEHKNIVFLYHNPFIFLGIKHFSETYTSVQKFLPEVVVDIFAIKKFLQNKDELTVLARICLLRRILIYRGHDIIPYDRELARRGYRYADQHFYSYLFARS